MMVTGQGPQQAAHYNGMHIGGVSILIFAPLGSLVALGIMSQNK